MLILTLAGNFGFDAASIVALLGSVGVAIGLAIQGSLSNLAGGVLILLLKPFKVGDYIKVGTYNGTVEEITFRSRSKENCIFNRNKSRKWNMASTITKWIYTK